MTFVDKLANLDSAITLALNTSVSSVPSDLLFRLVSQVKFWLPFYLLLVFVIWRKLGLRKMFVILAAILLCVLACDQLGNVFKAAFGRLRPCYNTHMLERGLNVLESRGGFFGFYSAHSANTFGLAVCCSVCLAGAGVRKRALLVSILFIWAATVAFSRIIVGKHFLGDVLAGAFAGALIGMALGYAASFFIRRIPSFFL